MVDRQRYLFVNRSTALRRLPFTTSAEWQRSVPPKLLEPIRCQRGVCHGVLDIFVPEVVLDCPRVAAIVGELVAAGMAQHVRMNLEREAGLDAKPSDHPTKAADGEWRPAFGHEHVRRLLRFAF